MERKTKRTASHERYEHRREDYSCCDDHMTSEGKVKEQKVSFRSTRLVQGDEDEWKQKEIDLLLAELFIGVEEGFDNLE